MDVHPGEYLRRKLSLFRFYRHFIASDFLVLFTAQDRDHVKSGATCQSGSEQFNRLGSSIALRLIDDDLMTGTGLHDELGCLRKRKLYFGLNHGNHCPLDKMVGLYLS